MTSKKKVLAIPDSWRNRYVSVYGKVCVVKALMLPKLTHIATVLPTMKKNKLNKLNKERRSKSRQENHSCSYGGWRARTPSSERVLASPESLMDQEVELFKILLDANTFNPDCHPNNHPSRDWLSHSRRSFEVQKHQKPFLARVF